MPADFNTLVNDDGTNTLGTLILKADLQALLMGAYVARTDTGAVNNWAPGIAGHTFVAWNGAADMTLSGIAGGQAGLTFVFRNTSTTKIASFLHQSGSSSAGNKFTNTATSGATPVAPGGFLAYRHDGTDWQLIAYEQGGWITPTFAAGDYTAATGTWTVAAGDVTICKYKLSGRTLEFTLALVTTDVSATPASLRRAIPGGFTPAAMALQLTRVSDNGAAVAVGVVQPSGSNLLFFATLAGGAWATAAATTSMDANLRLEVT